MKNLILKILCSLMLFIQQPVFADQEISKQQAINTVQQTHPGRILSVKQQDDSYHIKVLGPNGEVRILVVDKLSGKIIKGQ